MSQIELGFSVIPDADKLRIEEEHTHLERYLKDLVDACTELASMNECAACGREKGASCKGRLSSFQFDFLDLVAEHIENEENIMRNHIESPEDSHYFRLHQVEHVRLMDELRNKLMHESSILNKQGKTAEAIRMLHTKLTEIFKDHCEDYDSILLKYLSR